jgi:integrase
VTNRYRKKVRGFRGSSRDAHRLLREMIAEVEAGRSGPHTGTVQALLEEWLPLKAPDLSPTTLAGYRNKTDVHILPKLGHLKVVDVRPKDLTKFYRELAAGTAGTGDGKPLKASSIRQVHAVLRGAFWYAIEQEWRTTNPAAAVQPPKVSQTELQPPTPAEVRALIAEASRSRTPEFGVFVHVAAVTGRRRGELCGLKWRDVRFDKQTVVFVRSVIDLDGGRLQVKETKTGAVTPMRLDDGTLRLLCDHREMMESRARTMGVELDKESFVFSDELSGLRPWSPARATRAFTRVRDRLGLSHVHLHSERHYAATEMLAAGTDPKTAAARGGWSRPAVMLNVYAGAVQARDDDAADLLGGLVAGG